MRRASIAIVSSVLLSTALVMGGPILAVQTASAQSANESIGS